MNPVTQNRLIQDIFFSLQTSHSMREMVSILSGYGVANELINDYTQTEIKKLLATASSKILLLIADDLKIDTSNYVIQKPTKGKETVTSDKKYLKKIFISHSYEDREVVTTFIHMLQAIGIPAEAIFCTSLKGYGTPLGNDFMEEIKERLNEDVLVIFMLSDNFYESAMCLIEMGAAWIQTKSQISVAITPFKLDKIKGVFKHFQGIEIEGVANYDLLKETLESKFDIVPKRPLVWSPLRDSFLKIIQSQIKEKLQAINSNR
ncbi:toll/interleukin-1 receptor domain-containing protein [uncultured Kordia sp.]|uniref:toll/interleukin-1 receptor domain-containing protein n=1 Tax=uncultured Kordia sp. TaxID=507699 RepID=UPI00261F39E1|nr:toll/interleukin-1 receptor domain-containing protein [uncultured Kordia sp.]